MIFRTLLGDLATRDELLSPRFHYDEESPIVPGSRPAPFTPEVASSKQMQSEHTMSDDMPVDVNPNAVLAREQAAGVASHGKATSSNTDRREKLADAGAGIFKIS